MVRLTFFSFSHSTTVVRDEWGGGRMGLRRQSSIVIVESGGGLKGLSHVHGFTMLPSER